MTKLPDVIWCVDCGGRFQSSEIANSPGCPKCGSNGIPCSGEQDVTVEVNWHELRILAIWAENFAQRTAAPNLKTPMIKTVTAIARRLQQQHPTFPPLTLSAELAQLPIELKKHGVAATVETVNIPQVSLIPVHGPGAIGHAKKP